MDEKYGIEYLAKRISACFILVGGFLLIYGILISPGEKGLTLQSLSERVDDLTTLVIKDATDG